MLRDDVLLQALAPGELNISLLGVGGFMKPADRPLRIFLQWSSWVFVYLCASRLYWISSPPSVVYQLTLSSLLLLDLTDWHKVHFSFSLKS